MSVHKRDWKELCEAACNERDSEHLKALITELLKALDERSTKERGGPTRERAD